MYRLNGINYSLIFIKRKKTIHVYLYNILILYGNFWISKRNVQEKIAKMFGKLEYDWRWTYNDEALGRLLPASSSTSSGEECLEPTRTTGTMGMTGEGAREFPRVLGERRATAWDAAGLRAGGRFALGFGFASSVGVGGDRRSSDGGLLDPQKEWNGNEINPLQRMKRKWNKPPQRMKREWNKPLQRMKRKWNKPPQRMKRKWNEPPKEWNGNEINPLKNETGMK